MDLMEQKAQDRMQYIALGLIIFAALCLGVGEHRGWVHLIDFANMFGGGGVGILTGNKMTSNTKNGRMDVSMGEGSTTQVGS